MDRKKLVHQLDTPFSAVQWPQISPEDQDVILELLCTLLTPLGTHRTSHVTPSKGKRRSRKRKRAEAPAQEAPAAPPPPEIAAYVDVGLSRITRTLQTLSSKPGGDGAAGQEGAPGPGPGPGPGQEPTPYSVVFVARSSQPSAFHGHFPQMVAAAARSHPEHPAARLVGFSRACEDRLSACLGIPRVSSVALRAGAPHADALVDHVRRRVPAVDVPWLEQAAAAAFRETRIGSAQTTVGEKRQKKP